MTTSNSRHDHNRRRQRPNRAQPPQAEQAEAALIGIVLRAGRIPDALGLAVDDFYRPAHRTIWAALQHRHDAGDPIDLTLLVEDLRRDGTLEDLGGHLYLFSFWEDAPTGAGHATAYAERIADASRRRQLIDLGTILAQLGGSPDLDDRQLAADYAQRLADLARTAVPGTGVAVELDDFLTEPDPEYDWLVDGLLERGDRLILTGPEGGGKSTFLRQLAVQLPAGIHPFTLVTIPSVRVLLVDLENSRAHTRRELRTLRLAARDHYTPGACHIVPHPQGLDLLQAIDVAWLDRCLTDTHPDLLIIGPLYKLAAGDPTEEQTARAVSAALDTLRVRHRCALAIEAHTPHATGGAKHRPIRPYGASMWLRWPEFGIHLDPAGAISHWRGQRDERDWPLALRRGGAWPWAPTSDPVADMWERIHGFVMAVGHTASQRRLARELGTSKTRIQRAIRAHQEDWDLMRTHYGDLPEPEEEGAQ